MQLSKIYGVEGDDYYLHRVVTFIFDKDEILFHKRNNYIIVISKQPPKNTNVTFAPNAFVEHIGNVNLKNIIDDSSTNFILRCNPVKRNISTRKYQPVFGKDNIINWLNRKIENAGFTINGNIDVKEDKSISIKNGDTITHHEVIITGTLIVSNYQLFESFISNGIGQAKFLGFGLFNIFDNI